jgi:outer membrane protein assembly factor BamB
MKKLFAVILLAVIVAAGFYAVQGGLSKTKAYYAGDAIYFNKQVLVTSTNTGKLEIFRAEGASLKRVFVTSPVGSGFDTFNSAIFADEGGRLYIYATSGATLFKYDASDLSRLEVLSIDHLQISIPDLN